MARDGRGTKKETLFSSRAAALVSRVSRLRRSRARALLSLNLKKKRDCSQSSLSLKVMRGERSKIKINKCNEKYLLKYKEISKEKNPSPANFSLLHQSKLQKPLSCCFDTDKFYISCIQVSRKSTHFVDR